MNNASELFRRLEALEALVEQTRNEIQRLRAEVLNLMRQEERQRQMGPKEFKEKPSND